MRAVTVTGSNDFGRLTAVRQLVGAFVAEHGDLAFERLDAETHEFVRIQEALTSPPFLASKKMVLIANPSASAMLGERLPQLIADLPDSTELLLVEPKFDKRSSLYKFLKKDTDFREYEQLDAAALARWLSEEAKTRGGSLNNADARYLIERVGQNQQLLSGELAKLLLHDPTISRSSIELMTEAVPQSTIFELIDAVFSKAPQKALALYEEQRRLKVEPQQIIAMLAWQLHVLAVLCAAADKSIEEIAAATKLNAFTLRKSQRLAAALNMPKVRVLVDQLLSIDMRSKRQAIDLDEALKNYILQQAA